MLHEVLAYAERIELKTEQGFATKPVKWLICCDLSGKFTAITSLENGEKIREFSNCPDLGSKTQGAFCNFLAEKLKIVTLFDPKNHKLIKSPKNLKFLEMLDDASDSMAELRVISDLLKNEEELDKINEQLRAQRGNVNDRVSFMVGDCILLEKADWHDWWRSYYKKISQGENNNKQSMVCIVTGNEILPMLSHPKIGGLKTYGGRGQDSLISFDKDAFKSYGLKDSENAAMSADVATCYVETINKLISNQGINLANIRAVYWFGHALKDDQDDIFALLDEPNELLAGADSQPKKLFTTIKDGKERANFLSNYYYTLIVSGASGRVMVRDWLEGTFSELAENINRWFDDLSIVSITGEKNARLYGIEALVTAFLSPRKPKQQYEDWVKPLGSLSYELWRVALTNKQFPYAVISRLIPFFSTHWIHFSSETEKDKNIYLSLTYRRLGLLKAYHKRKERKNGENHMQPNLNPAHPSPAYQCGRLLAVLADLQYAALGDVGAGVVQRYYTATSQAPALRIGQLMSNAKNHLNKVGGGLAFEFENRIGEIMNAIPQIPRTLDLEEQSLFALGYYQQLADIRARMTENKAKKQAKQNELLGANA
jgi:CRISPR-associated protein Csd1